MVIFEHLCAKRDFFVQRLFFPAKSNHRWTCAVCIPDFRVWNRNLSFLAFQSGAGCLPIEMEIVATECRGCSTRPTFCNRPPVFSYGTDESFGLKFGTRALLWNGHSSKSGAGLMSPGSGREKSGVDNLISEENPSDAQVSPIMQNT